MFVDRVCISDKNIYHEQSPFKFKLTFLIWKRFNEED